MKRIITIGREFGSGGRELGRRLAEELGIAYYDQEIVDEIAKRTALSRRYVQQIVERRPILSYPIHTRQTLLTMTSENNSSLDPNMSIYREQANILMEMASLSDCVIVGRCADYVLRQANPLRIFVYADLESRIRRCRERAHPEEAQTDKELRQRIQAVDRNRAQYYAFYTGQTWGKKQNYDLCLNTSHRPIHKWVSLLVHLIGSPT